MADRLWDPQLMKTVVAVAVAVVVVNMLQKIKLRKMMEMMRGERLMIKKMEDWSSPGRRREVFENRISCRLQEIGERKRGCWKKAEERAGGRWATRRDEMQ